MSSSKGRAWHQSRGHSTKALNTNTEGKGEEKQAQETWKKWSTNRRKICAQASFPEFEHNPRPG